MGRLIQLELENFKSYAGKQTIGPFSDFTCIVGPNGAGKSNMMDAISFVLGVQSKHLRSNHLKELIFKKDADSESARRASVKLVYETSKDEVEGRNEKTCIEFMRSINGSGSSDYHIDNKKVQFVQYDALLQQIGVLVKARNFLVFQGDVETVASKSPLELTKLLEQICGSDNLCEEYEELKRKRDEAEENTIFSIQKKKMYLTQCKEVKGQKEEAESYKRKQDDLGDLKTEHILWQLWRVKTDMDGHQAAVAALKAESCEVRQKESDLENEMKKGKADFAKASLALTAAEKDLQAKNKQLDTVTPKLSEARAKMKSLAKRRQALEISEAKVNKDIAAQVENVESLRRDLAEATRSEAELLSKLDSAADSGVKLSKADLTEYSRLRAEVSAAVATSLTHERTIDGDLKSRQQQLLRLNSQTASLRREMEAGEKLFQEYSDRATKLQAAIVSNSAQKAELVAERDRRVADMQSSSAQIEAVRSEIEEVSGKLREVGNDKRRSKQEERMTEAVDAMKMLHKGVFGKLVDLCRPIQRKYAQAIMVAAGKQMDAIVVDTRETAVECMRYLKDHKVGVCQFLPLDNISSPAVSESLRALGSAFRPCIDLIECEEQYRSAVLYAVGSTIVCNELRDAQDLCFSRNVRVKAVTLNGQVISKSGAMTGGSSAQEGGTDRWAEKEVARLRSRLTERTSDLSRLEQGTVSRQHLVDIESRIRTLDSKMQFNEADVRVNKEKLAQLAQQTTLREETSRSLAREERALESEIAQLEVRLVQHRREISEVEETVFGAFSARVGIPQANIRDHEEKSLRRHQELLTQLTAVRKQVAELTSSLKFESKRDFERTLQSVHAQLQETCEELVLMEEQEQALLDKELQMRAVVKTAVEKVQQTKDAKAKVAASNSGDLSRRSEIQAEKESLDKRLAAEENLVERCRAQLHETLQCAQVDQVALPTVEVDISSISGSAGESSSDLEDTEDSGLRWTGTQSRSEAFRRVSDGHRAQREDSLDSSDAMGSSRESRVTGVSAHFSQSNDPTVKRDSRMVAKVDLSSMRKHKNLSKAKVAEKESELARSIAALEAELEKVQPNMHAAERYEGVMEKLGECNRDLDATREVARDIGARFEEVKKSRQDCFKECYAHVSESLGVIYKDLTRSSKHPLGGNAYLTLDNTDEPYLGGIRFTAMPPMKRFRDMEQLSGGEKTMAALALLFSIHSYRQAPFFVLDEVDAALDNVNVKKICNYIKQRSRDFQCVVISLKDMFFEHADRLVGICKDVERLSSEVLTLDLTQYETSAAIPGSKSEQSEDGEDEESALSGASTLTSAANTPSRHSLLSVGSSIHGSEPGTPVSVDQRRSLGKRRTSSTSAVARQLSQDAIQEDNEHEE